MGNLIGRTGVEEPAFTLLLDRAQAPLPYQLRKYGQRMAIETVYSTEGSAFMALASYIGVVGSKPANQQQKSMAMTAPVIMEPQDDHQRQQAVMQFVLPADYDSTDKVPLPTDPRVHVKTLPPETGVAHRYNGSFSPQRAKRKVLELTQQLHKDGLDLAENDVLTSYQFWGFTPPFTLPWWRRNEVWIPLSEKQVQKLLKVASSCETVEEHN